MEKSLLRSPSPCPTKATVPQGQSSLKVRFCMLNWHWTGFARSSIVLSSYCLGSVSVRRLND